MTLLVPNFLCNQVGNEVNLVLSMIMQVVTLNHGLKMSLLGCLYSFHLVFSSFKALLQ